MTLTPEEAAFLLRLLDTPVQITPSQMPAYLQLVQGIAVKLQPKPDPEPAKEQTSAVHNSDN